MYRYYYAAVEQWKKFLKYFMIAVKGEEQEFTTGSINKAIFLLAIPMMLEMALESLFAVVDIFFVGKIGMDAIATVGLTESVMAIIYSVAIGLSMAVTAMVARRIGEKNPEAAAVATGQAIIISLIVSLAISIVGIFYSEEILISLGASASVVETGTGYTRIMLTGNATIIFIFLLNAVFRGAGNASLAMRTLWLSNGLNIILDPLFIFGIGPFPEMGVKGAAVATTIGRGIGVLFQLYHLFGGNAIVKLAWRHLHLNLGIIKKIIEISVGGIGQFLIESASWIFLVRILSIFGSEAVAGFTIAIRMVVFTIMPLFGISNAAATLVGQNLGANQPERAEQSVWRTANFTAVFLAIIAVVFFTWASDIIKLFAKEPEVIAYGIHALKIMCLGYVFFGFGMIMSQSLNGAGDTKTPTFINLVCFWMLQLPIAYFLAVNQGLGPEGVFISVAISFALHAIASVYFFRLGKWKVVKV